MKKLNVLLLSVVAMGATVVSCSKEEDAPAEVSLKGKWTISTVSSTNGETTSPAQAYDDAACAETTSETSYFDFKAEGIMELGDLTSSTAEEPCVMDKLPGTWKQANKTLKLNLGGGEQSFPIVSATATKVVIKQVNPQNAAQYFSYTLLKK